MKPIERFQALLDGKKIRRLSHPDGIYIKLEDGIPKRGYDKVNFKPLNESGFYCLFREDDWELYEEPKPEIKLTPAMVGRAVRLRDGQIHLITECCKDGEMFRSSSYIWEANGESHLYRKEYDIVEVLPR